MSGIGRGRGWLNVNKTQRPGPPTDSQSDEMQTPTNQGGVVSHSSNSKYANIISKIALYNENDDGILLNQKLKHITKVFRKDCINAAEVNEAFVAIHEHCLIDDEFASKTIGMISTTSFQHVDIHGVRLQLLFIRQFQNDYEGCKTLQTNNPNAFRITVKMLGEFFHKARLSNGVPFKFLTGPIVTYLDMLLDASSELDFQLFTVQLYMNGNVIKERSATELNELLIKARTIIATNTSLTTNSKLWLLMALDIANTRFNILPADVHQFYLEKLGDVAMARIRKLTTELSIQTTYLNATLDSIQSNVNVLQQVSSSSDGWESPSSTIIEQENTTGQTTTTNTTNTNTTNTSTTKEEFVVKTRNNSLNNIGTWEQPKNEKTPRPILGAGAGARVKHEPKNNDTSWRDRKTPTSQTQTTTVTATTPPEGGGEWKKNNWGDNNKKTKQKKGWEHDDRFENDY